MSSLLTPEIVKNIKAFVHLLKANPDVLHAPELSFLKDYLVEELGATIPPKKAGAGSGDNEAGTGSARPSETAAAEPEPMEPSSDEEEAEPYPELDMTGVIEPDQLPSDEELPQVDLTATPSDEDIELSNGYKREAIELLGDGKFDEAIQKFTLAIKHNPTSALLWAKRGQAYLKLDKPNACIRDCNKALEINPDSAVAYKFRGRGRRLLGQWHDAANDLRQACTIDLDEQADEWLKEVTPNARKVEEWTLRKHRHDEEKELKRRQKLAKERMKAHEEAKKRQKEQEDDFGFPGGMPGGFPGMGNMGGGMPGGFPGMGNMGGGAGGFPGMGNMGGMPGGGAGGMPGLDKLLSDPEILELFADPEVSAAFNEITQNPMNIMKHQSNPKVAKLLGLMQKKMGGAGGMPGGGMGGFPGGMGGFGGGSDMPPEPPKGPSGFTDDLD